MFPGAFFPKRGGQEGTGRGRKEGGMCLGYWKAGEGILKAGL